MGAAREPLVCRPTSRDIELVRLLSDELQREQDAVEPLFTEWERDFIRRTSRQVQRQNSALSERQRWCAERIAARIESQAPIPE